MPSVAYGYTPQQNSIAAPGKFQSSDHVMLRDSALGDPKTETLARAEVDVPLA